MNPNMAATTPSACSTEKVYCDTCGNDGNLKQPIRKTGRWQAGVPFFVIVLKISPLTKKYLYDIILIS